MPTGVKFDTMVKLGESIDFYETHNSKSFKIICRTVFTEILIVMEGKLSDTSQHWVNDIWTLLGVKFDTTVILVLNRPEPFSLFYEKLNAIGHIVLMT